MGVLDDNFANLCPRFNGGAIIVDSMYYSLERQGINKSFQGKNKCVYALKNVDIKLKSGDMLGIVGESGSGKSTLAMIACGLLMPDSGCVLLDGKERGNNFDGSVQLIFQNSESSFNPSMKIMESLTEPIVSKGINKSDAVSRINYVTELCGLGNELLFRYPGQLSGGQCQRAAIARALVAGPKLLICDEMTSALDAKSATQIKNLMLRIKEKYKLTALVISHDLRFIKDICDNVAVFYKGEIIEQGKTALLFDTPKHEYLKSLVRYGL